MTPQEQQLLEAFLNRLDQTRGVAKDPEAEALIQQRLAGHPDALYLLVQRAILLEQSLALAQQHSAQASAPSFLGPGAAAPRPSSWRERFFGATPAPPPPAQAQPSFLASAATTAAGVAGGMFLAQGLENLFGGHHDGGNIVENDVVNNVIYDNGPSGGYANDGLMADHYDDASDFDDGSWS